MTKRSIEDKLREEYFNILPIVRRIRERLEAEVRYKLIPILNILEPHERFEVHSRVKECESSINALQGAKRVRHLIQINHTNIP